MWETTSLDFDRVRPYGVYLHDFRYLGVLRIEDDDHARVLVGKLAPALGAHFLFRGYYVSALLACGHFASPFFSSAFSSFFASFFLPAFCSSHSGLPSPSGRIVRPIFVSEEVDFML